MKTITNFKIIAMLFACLLFSQAKSQCTANFSFTAGSNGVVTFTNNSLPASSSASYQWSFGDSQYSSLANPTHTYGANGTYVIILQRNDTLMPCTSTYTAQITISNVPCILYAGFNFTVHPSGSVTFANTSTGTIPSTYYYLQFGDGQTQTFPNNSFTYINHTYTASGVYNATLSAFNNSATCTSTSTLNLNVTVQPCSLTANFTSTVNNGTVNFSSTSTGTTSTSSYYWNFGNSNIGYGVNPPTQNYLSNGIYTVTLYVNDSITSNCSATVVHTINITNAPCVSSANFSMFKDSTITSSIVWNAYPAYPSNVSNVVWNWGDNTTSTGLYPSHTYSAAGFYNICLTVSVSCGTITTTCLNTNIYRSSSTNQVATINVINPLVTGIAKNNTASVIRLFPNPVKDILTIENSTGDFNIVVTDLYGKVVYAKAHSANDSKVDLQNLNSGIYFIKVSGADYSKSIKIIKE